MCGYDVCVLNIQNGQHNAILAVNSIERSATFNRLKSTLMYTLCFHIDSHVMRYQYLTISEVAVSCDAYGGL